jgi:hypothetical protein
MTAAERRARTVGRLLTPDEALERARQQDKIANEARRRKAMRKAAIPKAPSERAVFQDWELDPTLLPKRPPGR